MIGICKDYENMCKNHSNRLVTTHTSAPVRNGILDFFGQLSICLVKSIGLKDRVPSKNQRN
jgi:hypothetical protein